MSGEHYPTAFSPETYGQTSEYLLEGTNLVSTIARGVGPEIRRRVGLFVRAHELHNYMPEYDPQTPEFDGDTAAFIAKARETFATLSVEPRDLRVVEKRPTAQPATIDQAIFTQYVNWRRENLKTRIFPLMRERSQVFGFDGDTGTTYRDGLAPYMLGTVKALTAFNTVAADEQFKVARREILNVAVPGSSTALRERIEAGKISGVTLNVTERQLRSLPYACPNPNFFNLCIDDQRKIIQAIGEEFLVFVKYATRYGDAEILRNAQHPVLQRSAWELDEVMKVSSDPKLDFHSYTHDIEAFDRRLAEVRAQSGETDEELSFDQQLLQLKPGEILPLTQTNETIRYSDLSQRVDDALARVAQTLYAVRYSGMPNLEINKQWNSDTKDIVARLVAKSNGRIANVRYQAVEVEEYLQAVIKDWDPDETPLDTARAYTIMADIRSGSKTVPTAFEFAIYITRNPKGISGRVVKSVRGRSTGDQVIADEIQRSRSVVSSRVPSGTIVNKTKLGTRND